MYTLADESFLVNDEDIDLRPIRISLPKPPDLRRIAGYADAPQQQRFERVKIPYKLLQLEEDAKAAERARAEEKSNYTITRFRLQKRK